MTDFSTLSGADLMLLLDNAIPSQPHHIINIHDPDQLVTTMTCHDDHEYMLCSDIIRDGSISVYLDAKNCGYLSDLAILERNGFKLSLLAEILYLIKHDDCGDCPAVRLEHLISHVSRTAVVKGHPANVDQTDYRCFTTFYFNQKYTGYEYNKWIGSCIDLSSDNSNLQLICILNSGCDVAEIISVIMPALSYQLENNILIFNLTDINKYLN